LDAMNAHYLPESVIAESDRVAVGRVPFGIGIPQVVQGSHFDLGVLRETLQVAEELGFHSAWIMDQALTTAPALEAITTLGYAAALTDSIRLGTGVLLTALRQPVQLARHLATLDQLSSGRLILGVGLGERSSYHPAFGVSPSHRAARFVESLELLKRLWTENAVTFSGRFWQTEGLTMEPKPFQKPHPPIWFGGGSKPAIDRAVRNGDGWMGAGNSTVGQFTEQVSLLREALDATGRDPASFTIAKRVYLAVSLDTDRSLQRMRAWSTVFYGDTTMADTAAVVGDLELCLGRLSEVSRSGADLIVLNPVFDVIDQMKLLAPAISVF
jgi:probable F420-dependent oxidoreductase